MDLMHNSNRTMKITLENNTIDRKIVAAAWTKDFVASQENTACMLGRWAPPYCSSTWFYLRLIIVSW